MVLLNNNFEHKVERVKTDQGGNFLIIEINTQGKEITLLLIYIDPMKITLSFIIILGRNSQNSKTITQFGVATGTQ